MLQQWKWTMATGALALMATTMAPRAQAPAAQALAAPASAARPATTLSVPGRSSAAPWVASHGRYVAVAWGAQAEAGWDVYAATSEDEGATFTAPVRVNRVANDGRIVGEIPPRVALHMPPGASRPAVVVAWNAKDRGTEIKLSRSTDFGRSFTAPQSLQSADAAGDRGWQSLAVDTSGTAHVVWLDHRGLAEPAASSGATAGHASAASHARSGGAAAGGHGSGEHDGVAMAQKSRLHYARAGAAATTITDETLAAGVCYCCKTAIVATGRGVLAAWRHVYAGDMRDIAFAWLGTAAAAAAPARVNADGWSINGCPDDGPALAVGARDRVHIVWPTVVPGPEPMGALFHSVMTDGATFGPRQRVPTLGAPKPSHPQVAFDGTGQMFVAWDEVRDGVRTAAIVEASAGADGTLRFGAPAPIAPGGPTQYPVMAPLARGVVLVYTSGAPGASTVVVHRRQPSAGGATAAR